ncbi:MAG TPA: hypothetical protein VK741_10045 [Acetobacteraceae bacterium]|jgi:hypothetical protein|nr:hypothetical protein [Acetobacteraceae bacterium]
MNVMSKATDATRNRIAAQYGALDCARQAVLLARLADRFSLMARDTYDQSGGVADAARLRAFNEAQNRILAQLLRLLTANAQRYPDDVFANILVDQFQTLSIDPEQTLAACLGAH